MTENTENKEAKPAEKKAPRGRRPQKPAPKKGSELAADVEERVVAVNRVAKVVKGGRRFSFSALVIVGDKKGRVGFGLGKAKEVPDAIRKASQVAAKRMVLIPIERGTIPHTVLVNSTQGRFFFTQQQKVLVLRPQAHAVRSLNLLA